jgi:2-dehydropantoate 2-reductase
VRFIIYGAGAVGATLGARLSMAGQDVVFIARGAHLQAMVERGLRFATPERAWTLRIPAVAHPSEVAFADGDVIILGLKGQDTPAAIATLVDCGAAGLPIVCAQNGIENERVALRFFANVHGMCVKGSTSQLEPGVVRAFGTPSNGIFDLGRFPAGVDDVDRAVAAALARAGFLSLADPDIMRRKRAKLVSNTTNALEAAAGVETRNHPLGERARAEARAVFAAAGVVCTWPPREDERDARTAGGTVDGITYEGNSTWQSLRRGASGIEADQLNGEIVLLGRLYGVPTPVNLELQRVAHRMLRERIPAGSFPVSALEERLG